MRQPVIAALMAAESLDPQRFLWQRFNDPLEVYGDDRDAYVRRRVTRVAPADELLRADGTWVDDGDFADDDLLGSGNWDRYYVAADAYLDALPEDVYVIRIRIHS
jgi:hypothetical protein